MTKKSDLPLPQRVESTEEVLMSGIFISEHEMANMKMERIVVSDAALQAILKITKLTSSAQEKIVADLVDRTPDWMSLDEDEDTCYEMQIAKIKTVLTQETVLEYLATNEVITKKVDLVEVGIDQEGSVVIYAYYTTVNREQRRAADKSMSAAEKEAMARTVNILGSDNNLVDLAKAKLERLKREGKSFKGKELT